MNYTKLDLNPILNYKSINHPTNEISEFYRISGAGEIFDQKYLPGPGAEYETNGIPFLFPKVSGKGFDTVCCAGQEIDLPAGTYKSLHIVGYCEGEAYREFVTLCGKHGEVSVDFFLYSSWRGTEQFDRDRYDSRCADAFLVKTDINAPRSVFTCKSEFAETNIDRMILPFNPAVFIYSITLS